MGSILIHLVLLGVIVLAERRSPVSAETESIDVELVPQAELPEPPQREKPEPSKTEATKPPEQKPEPTKPDPQTWPQPQNKPQQQTKAEPPAAKDKKPDTAKPQVQPPLDMAATPQAPPPEVEQSAQPEAAAGPSGGPSESKSKLTPEEIAALRAQIQKCWTLPIGIPNANRLEAVIRVTLARNGRLTAEPELLKASASVHGPVLVGIAFKALNECQPYRVLPAAKYEDWRMMDLRFAADGMAVGRN